MTPTSAPTPADVMVAMAIDPCLRLAAAVRDHDVDTAHDILTGLTRLTPTALQAMVLALAAMVPEGSTADDVLQYCEPATQELFGADPRDWSDEEVRAAHAAFQRRVARTPRVERGEREYHRRRHQRQKALRLVNDRALEIRREQRSSGQAMS